MDYLTVFILAIGLSLDSFAVSLSSGLRLPQMRFCKALKLALVLTFFQAFMPLLGWFLASSVKNYIAPVEHWIAFFLLGFIGGKMIIENRIINTRQTPKDPTNWRTAMLLGIATSLDALAVGFSAAMILTRIIQSVLIIGGITFIACMSGIFIGKKTSSHINQYAEIAGGLILIGIGLKILLSHLMK